MDILTTGKTAFFILLLAIGIPLIIGLIVGADVFNVLEPRSHNIPPTKSSTPYYSRPETLDESKDDSSSDYSIEEELSDFLHEWNRAFESKNLGYFMKFYHEESICRNLDYYELKIYQGRLFSEFQEINLTITDAKYRRTEDDRIRIEFIQRTRLDTFSDVGTVVMILVRNGNSYQIINEKWETKP